MHECTLYVLYIEYIAYVRAAGVLPDKRENVPSRPNGLRSDEQDRRRTVDCGSKRYVATRAGPLGCC